MLELHHGNLKEAVIAAHAWDGVECDQDTGHVIGLELESSFLHGSIDANSSLFDPVNLQTLNLADNYFNYSQTPSEIARLSMLSTLNLSHSVFYGQIPSEISGLSRLVSLDLFDSFHNVGLLKLEKPGLRKPSSKLIQPDGTPSVHGRYIFSTA